MKKILAILFIILSCFSLTACNKNYSIIKSNISEIRHNIFVGKSDNFDITFMSGKREKDYVINGYNTDLIDFGIITVTLNNVEIPNNGKFALTIDTLRYEDSFEKNPFDGTYVADIQKCIDNEIDSMTIKVFFGDIIEEIKLVNLSHNWQVNCYDALKLSIKEINNNLKPLITTEFLGEVYIKIIKDTIVNDGQYYWYVNFLGRNGTKHNVLINPNTKEILAKN